MNNPEQRTIFVLGFKIDDEIRFIAEKHFSGSYQTVPFFRTLEDADKERKAIVEEYSLVNSPRIMRLTMQEFIGLNEAIPKEKSGE
jgi:hypothetical protein